MSETRNYPINGKIPFIIFSELIHDSVSIDKIVSQVDVIPTILDLIGEGKIGELLYTAPVGDIYPLDVLYGYRRIIADGGYSMAHKNGFTGESLHDWFRVSSFKSFITAQDDNHYALWAIAYKTKERTLEQMKSELSLHLGLS